MITTQDDILEPLVLFLLLTGFISIVCLALGLFNVSFVVVVGLLFTTLITYYQKFYQKNQPIDHQGQPNHGLTLIILVLVALLFRSTPYFYVMGGQDQGLYVNMSAVFERTGQVFPEDKVAQQLINPSIRDAYERYNYNLYKNYAWYVEGEREGTYLPGIYIKEKDESSLVFQFYHLHPIWMAIFGTLFGTANRVYSLTLFSILSVLYFYLLAFELSNSRRLAFITGLLIALNPLHAFFSKFPVTEVVVLFFSSSAFYYLLRYHKNALQGRANTYHLLLSAGLMGCFFFTRISGFMYLPFFILLGLLTLLYVDQAPHKRALFSYYGAVFLLYLLSLAYGFTYSYPYSLQIHQFSFRSILRLPLTGTLTLFSFLMLLSTSWFYLHKKPRGWKQAAISYLQPVNKSLPYLMLLVLLRGLYHVYNLGFTELYRGNEWLDVRWEMVGQGIHSFSYSSIVVSVLYISPFLFLLFLLALFVAKGYQRLLLCFLLLFWVYIALLQWVIPYQYYYARYVLSEVVPYSILFAVASYPHSTISAYQKRLFYVIIVATSGYYFYYSIHQLQGDEAQTTYENLQVISKHIEDDDLLLLNKNGFLFRGEIQTALLYLFDKKVFAYHNTYDFGTQILPPLSQNRHFNELFILSQKKLYTPYLDLVDNVIYQQHRYEHLNGIPTKFEKQQAPLHLYKINEFKMYQFFMQEYDNLLFNFNPYLHKQRFYSNLIWTSDHSTIVNFNYDTFGKTDLILETNGWRPIRADSPALNLRIMINGQRASFRQAEENKYYFRIPEPINHIERIDIMVNTFVPSRSIPGNQDDRHLGIDIKEIYFE